MTNTSTQVPVNVPHLERSTLVRAVLVPWVIARPVLTLGAWIVTIPFWLWPYMYEYFFHGRSFRATKNKSSLRITTEKGFLSFLKDILSLGRWIWAKTDRVSDNGA